MAYTAGCLNMLLTTSTVLRAHDMQGVVVVWLTTAAGCCGLTCVVDGHTQRSWSDLGSPNQQLSSTNSSSICAQ